MGNKIKKKEKKMEKLVYICNIAAQIELTWRIPAIYWCNYVFYPMSRSDQIRVEREGRRRNVIEGGRKGKKRDNETRLGQRSFQAAQIRLHRVVKPRKTFPVFFE